MGWSLAKTASALSAKVKSAFSKRVAEAITPFLFGLTAGDGEDAKFRRITSPNTIRDLNPLMHERMQAICFYLAKTTPFGKRIVEVISDYVVGEGFQPVAQDNHVKELVKQFWSDPVNNFEENVGQWCDELTIFGELCLTVAVNPVSGFVRIGYVDPLLIESVEYGTMATSENASGESDEVTAINFPVAVHLKRRTTETVGKRLEIIRVDEDPLSLTFGQLKGECFYFAVNKAKGASRGLSELFSLADWIDVFDQMMFDFADRVRFLNAFIWHYTINGADEKKITDWTKKVTQNPPRQGSVQVTNEAVKIEAMTPDFRGGDMSQALRSIKLYGLGGAGLPAWFFADAETSNRSTADEMTGPTGKKLTKRQNGIKAMVRQMIQFQIYQAIYKGVLSESVDTTITLQVPDLLIKDLEKATQTMAAVVNSVSVMEANGYIQTQTAARSCHIVLSQIGVEVDPDEFDKAQEQKKNRDTSLLPEQTNLAKALEQIQGQLPGQQGANQPAVVQ